MTHFALDIVFIKYFSESIKLIPGGYFCSFFAKYFEYPLSQAIVVLSD